MKYHKGLLRGSLLAYTQHIFPIYSATLPKGIAALGRKINIKREPGRSVSEGASQDRWAGCMSSEQKPEGLAGAQLYCSLISFDTRAL